MIAVIFTKSPTGQFALAYAVGDEATFEDDFAKELIAKGFAIDAKEYAAGSAKKQNAADTSAKQNATDTGDKENATDTGDKENATDTGKKKAK